MIRLALTFSALTAMFSCADESLTGYGAAETVWVLQDLDGVPFAARAILEFPEEGALSGQGPCNTYRGTQSVPYPWFKAENIASTRMACPDLDLEATYFSALEAMTLAEVAGNTLILSNDDGRKMVFRAED
jgi:heat shock protein HslJ